MMAILGWHFLGKISVTRHSVPIVQVRTKTRASSSEKAVGFHFSRESALVPGKPYAARMVGQRKLRVRSGISRTVGYFGILLLAAALSTTADVYPGANSSSIAQPSSQNKSMRKNLPNFGETTTPLYRGGQPSKEGFRTLAKMGVNIVVDLRGSRDSERKMVTR